MLILFMLRQNSIVIAVAGSRIARFALAQWITALCLKRTPLVLPFGARLSEFFIHFIVLRLHYTGMFNDRQVLHSMPLIE